MKKRTPQELPTIEQLEAELERLSKNKRSSRHKHIKTSVPKPEEVAAERAQLQAKQAPNETVEKDAESHTDKSDVRIPSMEQVETERKRIHYSNRYRSALRSTIYTLIVVAAVAILVATMWLPFLRIYGTSMTPTLADGEIVVCLKTSQFEPGDIVAFYYNNKILVKRVVGQPGDWINIDEYGTVYVNNVPIDEPYLDEKSFGTGDVEFPYQVPESTIFVLGDHRSVSVDSRHSTVGCISQEQIVGKIIFRLWPIGSIGKIG